VIGRVNGVWTITDVVRNRTHLNIRLRQPIRKNDRRQVDVDQIGIQGCCESLILLENDIRNVRSVGASIALGGDMERHFCIFREPMQKHFKECIDILPGDGRSGHRRAVICI
jgi:hypothetical protein